MNEHNGKNEPDPGSRIEDLATIAMGLLAFGLGAWIVLSIAGMEDNVFAGMSPGISEKQYPNFLGIALMIGAVAMTARPLLLSVTARDVTLNLLRGAQPWSRIGGAILCFFTYFLAFEQLGYIASTSAFGAALMWIGGARSRLAAVIGPIGLSLAVYWIIRLAFSVHLPRGDIWSSLFGG